MNKEVVKTICYGHEKYWGSREYAEAFFLEAMMSSEGSERERYTNVYLQLKQGLSVCKDEEISEEQLVSKKFNTRFGDVTTISGENNVVHYNMNTFDKLEYDCWALIKKYADFFGFKIEHDYDKDDVIDFSLVKPIQDSILEIFEKAGIEFIDEFGEKAVLNHVSLDEIINEASEREQNQSSKDSRHIIWSDINIDFASWTEGLRAEYPQLSEDALYEKAINLNNNELKDVRSKLDIKLDQPIIMISNIAVGDSRTLSYNLLNSGNIKDCFYGYRTSVEKSEWFLDINGDLRHIEIHGNGKDYNLYRVFKENISRSEIDDFREKIYTCQVTRKDIDKVTDRLGDKIAEVYGWRLSKDKTTHEHTR